MRLLDLGIIAPPPQQGKDGGLVGQTKEGRTLRFRTADTDRKATQRIDNDKAILVGHIVADEDGPAAGEGWLPHEGGYGGTLVDTALVHFQNHLPSFPFQG